MTKCKYVPGEGGTATNPRMVSKQCLQCHCPWRTQGRHLKLIPALLLAELSTGHSPSHVSPLGNPADQSQLAAEVKSICHPCINLSSEVNLSTWSGISNNNKALPGRGQGSKGIGHRRGHFHYLHRSLRE